MKVSFPVGTKLLVVRRNKTEQPKLRKHLWIYKHLRGSIRRTTPEESGNRSTEPTKILLGTIEDVQVSRLDHVPHPQDS